MLMLAANLLLELFCFNLLSNLKGKPLVFNLLFPCLYTVRFNPYKKLKFASTANICFWDLY